MTLAESICVLLKNAGIENAFIIDAPESTLDAGAVVIIPYSSDSEEFLPIGTQYFQVRASAVTFPASETLIWQAWVGYVLDYLAVAGWVGFVESDYIWSGCVGLGMMVGCSILALWWFHRPYRYALLSVCPEDLDKYNRLRYGRRLDKAAAKGKRKRVLSLFSRFVVYKCINNNFDLGTDFSSPADDALRTLEQLRLARISFRYLFDKDYKLALNSEIQNFGKMLDKLADNMLAKYAASAIKEGN